MFTDKNNVKESVLISQISPISVLFNPKQVFIKLAGLHAGKSP